MVINAKPMSSVIQKVRCLDAFGAAGGLSVIAGESGMEGNAMGAREGGSRPRFVPIQKDARCCYV